MVTISTYLRSNSPVDRQEKTQNTQVSTFSSDQGILDED